MKTSSFIVFVFFSLFANAQVKSPSQKTNNTITKEKPPKKTAIKPTTGPIKDSVINSSNGHNHGDTIKIDVPKDDRFDPANPNLKNSKIKTPVYNNQLTGTNAPGDVNTGIPPASRQAPPKITDSVYRPQKR